MKKCKKLLLFSGLFLLAGVLFVQKSYAVGTMPIGDSTNSDRNSDPWLLVYNYDGDAHEAGDVVVWKDATYDGLEVTTTTTANDGLVAGVVPYGQTLSGHSWGWIQQSGYHPAITIGVANSAGDNLVTSTTAEAAGVYSVAQATGTAANQSAISGVFAVALETTASSTTVKGFIRIK